MNKELLQQVLDALENSSDLVFKDLSKSYLRELAVNTLREAIAQPEQPAAPVAPIPALPVIDVVLLSGKVASCRERLGHGLPDGRQAFFAQPTTPHPPEAT